MRKRTLAKQTEVVVSLMRLIHGSGAPDVNPYVRPLSIFSDEDAGRRPLVDANFVDRSLYFQRIPQRGEANKRCSSQVDQPLLNLQTRNASHLQGSSALPIGALLSAAGRDHLQVQRRRHIVRIPVDHQGLAASVRRGPWRSARPGRIPVGPTFCSPRFR